MLILVPRQARHQLLPLRTHSESIRGLDRILEHARKTLRMDVPEDMIFAFPEMWGGSLAKSSGGSGAASGSFLATVTPMQALRRVTKGEEANLCFYLAALERLFSSKTE